MIGSKLARAEKILELLRRGRGEEHPGGLQEVVLRRLASLCGLSLLLGLALVVASPAAAVPIPIPQNPVLGSDQLQKLELGTGPGEYEIGIVKHQFLGDWSNKVGDRIKLEFEFTPKPSLDAQTMVVFTSLRYGVANNPITCADLMAGPPTHLQEASFDFVTDPATVGGSVLRTTESNDDRSGSGQKSQICLAESGSDLFSLVFDATAPGTTLSFSIEVAQTKDNVGDEEFANFKVLAQAYSAVPEPGTGLLLLGGLVALARVSRKRAGLA